MEGLSTCGPSLPLLARAVSREERSWLRRSRNFVEGMGKSAAERERR